MKITQYLIIDTKTQAVVGTYSANQRARASKRADKLDNQYGAHRYQVKAVFEEGSEA